MNKEITQVFIVDDDLLYLKTLELDFKQESAFHIRTFTTGEACLEHIATLPTFVILDYHLDGIRKDAINGLETLDRIKAFMPSIAVIMLSSQDKIEVAINCMHHHALDYVVKSETACTRLKKIMNTYLEIKKLEKQLNWYIDRS
jgi:DNA-binding NtrC family response regulator